MTVIKTTQDLKNSGYLDQYIEYVCELRGINIDADKYQNEVPNPTYFLALEGKELIGIARCSNITNKLAKQFHFNIVPRGAVLLGSLFIKKDHRGKGQGKLLLEAVFNVCPNVILETHPATLDFYKSSGFKQIDKRNTLHLMASYRTELKYTN